MQQPLTAATALAVSVCCVAAANATSPTRPHLALALAGGANATTPTQLHLALAGGADVRVAWRTAAAAPSACSWGPTNASMPFAATGASVEYLPGHGFHHAVKLAPLSASTVYWYSCGGSAPTSFTTAPPAGAPANFSAVIFGDWGYLDSTLRPPSIPVDGMDVNWTASLTRELLETLGPNGPGGAAASNDFTWIVGDIAYADDGAWHVGELFNFTYEEVYDGFVAWNENISSSVPLMVSPGNHESECHSPYCILELNSTGRYLANFSAYNARFPMPGPESGGVAAMWYSWDYADVHFVSIDTSTDFPGAPEGETGDSHLPIFPAGHFAADGVYMAWLASDLAAARARGARWILAGGHRPTEDLSDPAPLLALFKQYSVDAYFAGHGHSYYRYGAQAFGDGTVHIMVGGAGCDEMPWPADQLAAAGTPMDEEALYASPRAACESWCERRAVRRAFAVNGSVPPEADPCRYCSRGAASPLYVSDNMAIGRLELSASATTSTLSWTLLRAPDGRVLDTLVLTKPI